MRHDAMDLTVTQQRTADGTRRVLTLANASDSADSEISAFFDMVGDHDVDPPQLLDGFVYGMLLHAMRVGKDIRVRGRLSRQLLQNVHEFQDVWNLWYPSLYRKIRVLPDAVAADTEVVRGAEAFAAYSGGVDSTFTVLRHASESIGLASYPLRSSVLLVHGFDVPLGEPAQFDALMTRTAPFIEELGLKVRVIRTNLKDLRLSNWEHSFMAQLVCCMHNYSHEFGYALVASAKSYDELSFPIGSSPTVDHLFSGAAMRIVHDGAGFSRTHKVEAIAKSANATACVKVCWEGTNSSENCGVCEKCLRTRFNFRAVGVANPACFAGAPDPEPLIASMQLRRDTLCVEIESIVRYARAHDVNEPWVDALQQRIDTYYAEKREENYGRARAALSLLRRGEWKRLSRKIAGVMARASTRKVDGLTSA